MRTPDRTTGLVGLLLALLLGAAYAVSSASGGDPAPTPGPGVSRSAPGPGPAPALPTPGGGTPRADVPRPGVAYPVRKVGPLVADRSVLVNGRGAAELRYRRAAHNGTRLHFICTGCDAGTWLVGLPGGDPVGAGPLADPADVIAALDTVAPGPASSLLVKAPASALWTVTLTPFDAVPVHEQTFGSLGDDVVAVSARSDLQITCGGAASVRTLARPRGAAEYAVVQLRQEDDPGTWPVAAPTGSDLLILTVSCPGRWTLTMP